MGKSSGVSRCQWCRLASQKFKNDFTLDSCVIFECADIFSFRLHGGVSGWKGADESDGVDLFIE